MGMPRKIKNINAYADAVSYLGEVKEFEEPKLAIETGDWRGGGMIGKVKIDNGIEAMEASMTMGSHVAALIRKFGTTNIEGVQVRLVGAYQADDGSAAQAVEIYMGGRFTTIDLGKSAPGEDTEHKYTFPLTYYRRVVDGVDQIEIDMINGIFKVDGVDLYAEIMAILTS